LIRASLPQTGSESGGSKAQQETRTASLTPAPVVFDGKWIVEIEDLSSGKIDKQVTQISGNKFSASFNTGRFKGKITGAIDDSGQLKALISVVKAMGESGGGVNRPAT